MSMLSRRAGELTGLMAIGDGTMALLKPQEHVALWRGGPRWWDSMMQYFEERPTLTRTIGAASVLFGIWLAARQEEVGPEEV